MAVPSALWPIVPKATALSLGYDSGTTLTTLMNLPWCEGKRALDILNVGSQDMRI
ncbi:MAG: hypothetical protein NPIRA05_12120 [Nitrospirales bacterium]|nr:MAG: hypothetical protein NPIRA05_12120 [Nitrospirales bacterium]